MSKDRLISHNGKAYLKELILRRDPRLTSLLEEFLAKRISDNDFLQNVHQFIGILFSYKCEILMETDIAEDESFAVYSDLFSDTSLEVGKTLSKEEREEKDLNGEKVSHALCLFF